MQLTKELSFSLLIPPIIHTQSKSHTTPGSETLRNYHRREKNKLQPICRQTQRASSRCSLGIWKRSVRIAHMWCWFCLHCSRDFSSECALAGSDSVPLRSLAPGFRVDPVSCVVYIEARAFCFHLLSQQTCELVDQSSEQLALQLECKKLVKIVGTPLRLANRFNLCVKYCTRPQKVAEAEEISA